METEFIQILEAFNELVTLDTAECEQVLQVVEFKKVRKGQYLLHEGLNRADTIFVNDGCLKSFINDDNGKEHILSFSPKGWWTGDLSSFYTTKPNTINIIAIINTEVIIINKRERESLYEFSPKFERFFRILAEEAFINLQERILESLSLSAIERYNNFVKRYPESLQLLPQKQIAAFIGVTPEFLSKIKTQVL